VSTEPGEDQYAKLPSVRFNLHVYKFDNSMLVLSIKEGDHMSLEHGHHSITVEDNIIVIELAGSFNEYGARALTDDIIRTIKKFKGAPFCILLNDFALEGITPAGFKKIDEYNVWLNTQNMIAKATVVKIDVLLKMEESRIPAKAQQNIKSFRNMPDAIHWLKIQTKRTDT
tara:strand:- start:469 stop:981 length:513 start_codon:yes stop_codon:yes gene_type:complete